MGAPERTLTMTPETIHASVPVNCKTKYPSRIVMSITTSGEYFGSIPNPINPRLIGNTKGSVSRRIVSEGQANGFRFIAFAMRRITIKPITARIIATTIHEMNKNVRSMISMGFLTKTSVERLAFPEYSSTNAEHCRALFNRYFIIVRHAHR